MHHQQMNEWSASTARAEMPFFELYLYNSYTSWLTHISFIYYHCRWHQQLPPHYAENLWSTKSTESLIRSLFYSSVFGMSPPLMRSAIYHLSSLRWSLLWRSTYLGLMCVFSALKWLTVDGAVHARKVCVLAALLPFIPPLSDGKQIEVILHHRASLVRTVVRPRTKDHMWQSAACWW